MTQSHVISLRAQDPEERKSDANIRTSERGRPRVTQRLRAPSPELLKQTRDQGCGSLASLPRSPSLPPTLEFPAPAVPPSHTQSRALLALGVCALGLETSLLLTAVGCMCVCAHTCVYACATICVLSWAGAYLAHSPSLSCPLHPVVYIFTGPDHALLYTHATLIQTQKHALGFLL